MFKQSLSRFRSCYTTALLSSRATTPAVFNQQMLSMRTFAKLDVKLPDLGEGTKEATVNKIHVVVGQRVEEYEDLCEVFTDKLVAQIPSTGTGVVTAVNYGDDDVIKVGHAILTIETDEDDVPAEPTPAQTPKAVSPPAAVEQKTPVTSGPGNSHAISTPSQAAAHRALSTPAVRFHAKKEGIDINLVPATGKNGRVTKGDLLNYMADKTAPVQLGASPLNLSAAVIAPAPAQKTSSDSTHSAGPKYNIAPLYGISDDDKTVKIQGIKKAMVKTMTESLTIPFFTLSEEMDATALIALRKELKAIHPKLTMLPFFIKACSIAMTEYPQVNSLVDNASLDNEGFITQYVQMKDHNFSVAIDSSQGLTVPNIKQVQNKSILQIDNALKDLVERTANNQLSAADFAGSSFSVSSVGNIGGRYFVPTILRPQVAIIAIGKAHTVPKYDGKSEDGTHLWEPREAVNFSISADHRILDGASVAHFAARFKQLIENPNLMLLGAK